MDAQELRNLHEAYQEVYGEGYKPLPKDRIKNKVRKFARDTLRDTGTTLNPFKSDYEKDVAKHNLEKREKRVNKMVDVLKTHKGTQKEEVDIYDIILSHLLDEGYADTQQAAEAIMVNMSEEWRESIFEAEIEPPKERVGALTNIDIPMSEREAARQRTLAKAKAKREKRKIE
jgi:hypothetical protein